MLRTDKILAGLSRDMRFLEIGPSYNPIVPKRDGWKVWAVDHATREGLVAKYQGHAGVDVSRIEDVDFVLTDGPLDSIIPANLLGTINVCIASHVIEHTPDFVGFFKSLAKILSPAGIVSLAVPDKRFCFDYFRPHSTTGQIIDAHRGPVMRHRPAAIFDFIAYSCSIDGAIAWGQSPVGAPRLIHSLSEAWDVYSKQPSAEYVDCHAWQFTPSSFELIVLELAALKLIDFHIIRSFAVDGCEFIVQLQKGGGDASLGKSVDSRRVELLERIIEELGQQTDSLRARVGLAPPSIVREEPSHTVTQPTQTPHQTTIGRLKRIALTIPAIRWLNMQRHRLRALAAQSAPDNVGFSSQTKIPKIGIVRSESAHPVSETNAKDFLYAIGHFSVFQGTVRLSGWAYDSTSRIKRLVLRFPSGRMYELTNFKLPSPDVANVHGQHMKDCRFDDVFYIPQDAGDAIKAELVVEFDDKPSKVISALGSTRDDPAHALYARFCSLLREKSNEQPSGHLLEIGSRARSGITRRDIIPEGWQYTGLDVLPGPNVDVVGDAHRLSHVFPTERFNAVMALSVLEHLLMPWKFAIELNKVLLPGAIGIFTTHQSFPLHEVPWDFWRFSDQAWRALLNPATGFEIVDAQMGEPAFTVAQKIHAITNFGESPSYLASAVLFRKIAETSLDWPVEVAETISTEYPKGETQVVL